MIDGWIDGQIDRPMDRWRGLGHNTTLPKAWEYWCSKEYSDCMYCRIPSPWTRVIKRYSCFFISILSYPCRLIS
jgi:hypothetical protein